MGSEPEGKPIAAIETGGKGVLRLWPDRVRFENKRMGQAQASSMLLEEVASCTFHQKGPAWTLIPAAYFAVIIPITFVMKGDPTLLAAVAVTLSFFSILFAASYILFSTLELHIESRGGYRMRVKGLRLGKVEAVAFLDQLESAKGRVGR